jgi:spermidine/putrescine transport system substrate-binding protein
MSGYRRDADSSAPTGRASAAAWLRGVAEGRVSRREFVLRAGALGLSVSTIGGLLAACGGTDEVASTGEPSPLDTTLPQSIRIYNWGFYLSPKVKRGFAEQTGVKVVEDRFGSLDRMMATVEKGSPLYDVVFSSDVFDAMMRKADLIRPLDVDLLPNLANVTDPALRTPSFDDESDGHKYTVPYMFGTTGFAVRLDLVEEPRTSWDMLYDKKFEQRLSMLDGSREIIGPALFTEGFSLNTTDQGELDRATQKAIAQKPLVTTYDSVTQKKRIVDGLPLVQCWDGDAVGAINDIGLSKVRFVLPDEGFQIFADGLVVPKTAPSPYAAMLFLDYLLDAKVAAENSNYIGYQSAVAAADPMIESMVQRALRPTSEVLARGTLAEDLGDFNDAFESAYEQVMSA